MYRFTMLIGLFLGGFLYSACEVISLDETRDRDAQTEDVVESEDLLQEELPLEMETRNVLSNAMEYGGEQVSWGECPEGFKSECAHLEVPLNWKRPWGRTIELFISRYPATGKSDKEPDQLWLLAGGPGQSGEVFAPMFDTVFSSWRDTHDIYVIEHRGVGESTRLSCPTQESPGGANGNAIGPLEMTACLAYLNRTWGRGLSQFNVTNAAKDLEYAISITAQPGQRVFVFGGSYGTFWAQRYLQVAPNQATGVILDGIATPETSLMDYYLQVDPVARELSELCADDDFCSSKIGSDPWQFIKSTLDKISRGHCSGLGWSEFEISSMGSMLVIRNLFPHVFPVFYRLNRCSPADRQALKNVYAVLSSAMMPPVINGKIPRTSTVLQKNISLSEMSPAPVPSLLEIFLRCTAQNVFCTAASLEMRVSYDIWPTYEEEEYAGHWFQTTTPILALNGELDAATPWGVASRIEDHLSGDAQNYVQFPYSGHITLKGSHVKTPDSPTCAAQVMKSFTSHPNKQPDTSCLEDLAPIDFEVTPEEALQLYGQPDAYENPAKAQENLQNSQENQDIVQELWPLLSTPL